MLSAGVSTNEPPTVTTATETPGHLSNCIIIMYTYVQTLSAHA